MPNIGTGRTLLGLLTAAALLVPATPAAASIGGGQTATGSTTKAAALTVARAATAAPSTRVGGVAVRLRAGTRQVVTVHRTSGWHARVALWRRVDGQWVRGDRTQDGRIGYGGLVAARHRQQGTGTTPRGTFTLTEAFGNDPAPAGTHFPYRDVRRGDYWVQDKASDFYNTLRNKSSGGFRWGLPSNDDNSSERLRDYPKQYAWSVVVDFNRPPDAVRHRGSGIFLHVNGDGATAGCVSVPRGFQRRVLSWLRPARVPVIAIGG